MPEADPFHRPPIDEPIKQLIRDAFAVVPEGKTSAVLAIVDSHGARLHAAWKIDDHWKVGAVINVAITGKPSGYVAVEFAF